MRAEENDLLLRVIDLYKSYFTKAETIHVLKGIDFVLKKGEILVVVGASGVGKSTLLHILGTLDRPNKGKVWLGLIDLFSYPDKKLAILRNKTMGFVFQFHYLLPEFTALENVMMPALINGTDKQTVREKAGFLLEEVEIGERVGHKPSELSGGEKQRVALARALINSPQLVLADEPTGNLDRQSAEGLQELMISLSRKKQTSFIIATHNWELASKADRVIKLQNGKSIEVSRNAL
ncbi:MAG: ABC transporter ATP-binding protein [Candidatus Edwardsbacteria bacterium]